MIQCFYELYSSNNALWEITPSLPSLYVRSIVVKPLPNDRVLDSSKFKAHANNRKNVTQNLNFVLGRVENILGKGENADYQHFLLFPKCF